MCFEAGLTSDILFLSPYWTPLMQRKLTKSVKIVTARQTSFFWFCLLSLCGKHSKSQVPAPGPCLEKDVCHGSSLIRLCKEPCWIWCRNAPVVGWLLQWFPLCSSSLFPLGLPRKKVGGMFHPSFLPFRSFVGFLTTTYHIQTPCTGLKDFL